MFAVIVPLDYEKYPPSERFLPDWCSGHVMFWVFIFVMFVVVPFIGAWVEEKTDPKRMCPKCKGSGWIRKEEEI